MARLFLGSLAGLAIIAVGDIALRVAIFHTAWEYGGTDLFTLLLNTAMFTINGVTVLAAAFTHTTIIAPAARTAARAATTAAGFAVVGNTLLILHLLLEYDRPLYAVLTVAIMVACGAAGGALAIRRRARPGNAPSSALPG